MLQNGFQGVIPLCQAPEYRAIITKTVDNQNKYKFTIKSNCNRIYFVDNQTFLK